MQDKGLAKKNLPTKDTIKKRVRNFKQFLDRMNESGLYASILIAQGDELLFKKGYGYQNFEKKIPMSTKTALGIGSISKQFTAILILRLREQGLISVNDTLDKFFPEVLETHRKITIHQLLTHTSGLVNYIGDDFEFMPTEEFLEEVFSKQLLFPSGEDFSYSNVGYSLLGMIIEKLTKKSYQENLLALLEEIGIQLVGWFGDPKWNDSNSVSYYLEGERTGSISELPGSWQPEKPYWAVLANGGVCISCEDLHRYLRALITGKLISKDNLKIMLTPERENYAYGWDILSTGLGTMITHDGGNAIGVNAFVQYYLDLDLSVIVLSNLVINSRGIAFSIEKIIQPLLLGEELVYPPKVISSDFSLKLGKYFLDGLNNEEEYLEVLKLPNDLLTVNIYGQTFLNKILKIEKDQQLIFHKLKEIAERFGNHIIRKEWDEAFKLTKRKGVTEKRINILTNMITEFEKENGSITGSRVSGFIPVHDYYAACFLEIQGTIGKLNVPIIFQTPSEILGIRSRYSKAPITYQAKKIADKQLACYSLDLQNSFTIKILSDTICQIDL